MQDKSNKILEGDLISLHELIKILWRSKILVIVITTIFASCGYFYASIQAPSFSATSEVFIGSYNNNSVINPKVLKIYHPRIKWLSFTDPSGGEFISLSLSRAVSSEKAEIKMQKAVDYLLNTSNALIQKRIDDINLNKENEIKAIDRKIVTINQEIDRLSNLDKTLLSSYGVDTSLSELIIAKTGYILDIERINNSTTPFKLSKIITEVTSFKKPQRPILFFAAVGLIIGFILSIFLTIIKNIK
jgi:LPS O-antigen subunit length determinant protein (WzzB/FepE family)